MHQSTFMYFQSLWSYQRKVLITREERGIYESWPRRLPQTHVCPDYRNHKSVITSTSTMKGCLVYCMLTANYIWLYVPTTQHKFLQSLGTTSLQKPFLTLRHVQRLFSACASLSYFLCILLKSEYFPLSKENKNGKSDLLMQIH